MIQCEYSVSKSVNSIFLVFTNICLNSLILGLVWFDVILHGSHSYEILALDIEWCKICEVLRIKNCKDYGVRIIDIIQNVWASFLTLSQLVQWFGRLCNTKDIECHWKKSTAMGWLWGFLGQLHFLLLSAPECTYNVTCHHAFSTIMEYWVLHRNLCTI